MAKHAYKIGCECKRCVKEQERRALQAQANFYNRNTQKKGLSRFTKKRKRRTWGDVYANPDYTGDFDYSMNY